MPDDQEVSLSLNDYFCQSQNRAMTVEIVETVPVQRLDFEQEWRSSVRYVDKENRNIEREVYFTRDGEALQVVMVTEARVRGE